jgi:hypothetical protein
LKRGLLSPYQAGTLSAQTEVLEYAAKLTGNKAVDIEGIFYATAFQAGIDEFLVHELKDHQYPTSEFIAQRTTYLTKKDSDDNWVSVRNLFNEHLPEDWYKNEEYSEVWRLQSFLCELIDSMSLGSSLLLPSGIPDFAEAESLLPSELGVPVSTLLSSLTDVQTTGPVPQKVMSSENIHRFNEIITSDMFLEYSKAQTELDCVDYPIDKALPEIANKGRALFAKNKNVLALKKSSAGILQITPKLIDAAFGKLPGAISEVAANLGLNLMESRRRIVIYDFRSTIYDLLLSNLARMLKDTDKEEKVVEQ